MKPYEPVAPEEGTVRGSVDSSTALDTEDLELLKTDHRHHVEVPQQRAERNLAFIGQLFLGALLLITNVTWYLRVEKFSRPPSEPNNYYGFPEYQLRGFYHEWTNISRESVDEKWDGAFPPGGGSVSIPHSMAVEYGIPPAVESTTIPGNMVYIVSGYHNLHCMDLVRMQLEKPYGLLLEPDETQRTHIFHCIEAIRQALQCCMDPTLIPLDSEWPYVPDGQLHVCRNADAMFRFVEEHHHPLPGAEGHHH